MEQQRMRGMYRGVPLDEMSKEQLIVIIEEQNAAYMELIKQNQRDREFLLSLRRTTKEHTGFMGALISRIASVKV